MISHPIPQYTDEELTSLACAYYNEALRRAGRFLPALVARSDSDPAFLDRLRVNYLRHHVSDRLYPRGVILPENTYQAMQTAIYRSIAERYPSLWWECKRQLTNKRDD